MSVIPNLGELIMVIKHKHQTRWNEMLHKIRDTFCSFTVGFFFFFFLVKCSVHCIIQINHTNLKSVSQHVGMELSVTWLFFFHMKDWGFWFGDAKIPWQLIKANLWSCQHWDGNTGLPFLTNNQERFPFQRQILFETNGCSYFAQLY